MTPAEVWYAALSSQCGLLVITEDKDSDMQKLYEARKTLSDPDLDGISIMTSPDSDNEFWLVKQVR